MKSYKLTYRLTD